MKSLHKRLQFAFRGSESFWYPGYYRVLDQRTNAELCKLFGLSTDSPEYTIDNAFVVKFNWFSQEWVVRA